MRVTPRELGPGIAVACVPDNQGVLIPNAGKGCHRPLFGLPLRARCAGVDPRHVRRHGREVGARAGEKSCAKMQDPLPVCRFARVDSPERLVELAGEWEVEKDLALPVRQRSTEIEDALQWVTEDGAW